MFYLLAGILVLLLLFGLKHWFINQPAGHVKKQLAWTGLGISLVLLVLLLITGRFAWAWAAGVVALPWILRLLQLGRFVQQMKNLKGVNNRGNEASPYDINARLTPQQAAEILGLNLPTHATEIRNAHRQMMKRNHPDYGGSDYLAQLLNRARDRLLEDYP